MKRILICDDERRSLEKWEKQLDTVIKRVGADFTVQSIRERKELLEAISGLEERRKNVRRHSRTQTTWEHNPFDNADIVIVDYDLLNLDGRAGYVTGEGVAYLCRCYSRCGLIVALNRYGTNSFDLTLKGHPESYADLNLGSEQLANPGLWGDEWKGFRPWYWPVLPFACDSFERRWKQLINHLDKKVLSYLRFPEEIVKALPRSTREFLGRGRQPEVSTFSNFVTQSGNGLRPKDRAQDNESTARIAAARLGKWLERLVLSGQDILVDAPHLASRYPSLLKGDPKNIASWNRTTSFTPNKTGLRDDKIADFCFDRNDWLSRPAWYWKALSASDTIQEVSKPWSKEHLGYTFCEDLSRFLPSDATREFVADLPSNFIRRFVANPASPKARKFAKEIRRVDYRPSVRFSL